MENSEVTFSVLMYEGLHELPCVFIWLMATTRQMTKLGFLPSYIAATSELLLQSLLAESQETGTSRATHVNILLQKPQRKMQCASSLTYESHTKVGSNISTSIKGVRVPEEVAEGEGC